MPGFRENPAYCAARASDSFAHRHPIGVWRCAIRREVGSPIRTILAICGDFAKTRHVAPRASQIIGVAGAPLAVKSPSDSADPRDMHLFAGATALAIEPIIFTAIIGGALVLAALRMLAADIDYARRWYALRDEAHVLRERQLERLRSLRPKRR
jgi:hypothetical protein